MSHFRKMCCCNFCDVLRTPRMPFRLCRRALVTVPCFLSSLLSTFRQLSTSHVNSRTFTQLSPFRRSCIQSISWIKSGHGDCIASTGKRQSLSDPGFTMFLEPVHHLLEALNLIPRVWRWVVGTESAAACDGTEAFETGFALLNIGHKLLAGRIVRGESHSNITALFTGM